MASRSGSGRGRSPFAKPPSTRSWTIRKAGSRCVTYSRSVEHGGRFEVADERIENEKPHPGQQDVYFYYRFQQGHPVLNDLSEQRRGLRRESVKPEQSILSQVRDPESYPVLHWLQEQYERISLYRNWSFGPSAAWRREQSAHGRGDVLSDGGENLALVLSKIRSRVKNDLIESLRKLFDGIVDIHLTVDGGNVLLFLEESGGREIPATRLSDGTLRYLSLLAILLHPDPPPLDRNRGTGVGTTPGRDAAHCRPARSARRSGRNSW